MGVMGRCIGSACGSLMGLGTMAATHNAAFAAVTSSVTAEILADRLDKWEERIRAKTADRSDHATEREEAADSAARPAETRENPGATEAPEQDALGNAHRTSGGETEAEDEDYGYGY